MSRAMARVSSLLLVVVVASLAGCAAAPPAPLPPAVTLQPGDLKSLAGEWEGSVTGSRTGTFDGPRLSGTMSVKEDGSFTSNLSGQPGVGQLRIVDGKRKSVSLEFARTTRPGVFALKKQWSDAGTWTLLIAVAQGKDDQVQAIVNVGSDGRVASVRVPTRRQGDWTVPAPVSVAEIDKELRARAAN